MKKSIIALFSAFLLFVSLSGVVNAKTFPPGFDFQGHRGARGVYPENTMPAFNYAADLGVTTLELDLQLSEDGVPVISHNPRLAAYFTQYKGKWVLPGNEPVIRHMTVARIKKYTVGETDPRSEYYKNKTPGQHIVANTTVPTLEELFVAMTQAGFNRIRYNIELKSYPVGSDSSLSPEPEYFVKSVMDVIRRCGMQERVTIQSFDWRILSEVRRLYKDQVLLSALTVEQPGEYYRQKGVEGCSPWMGGLDIDDFDGNYVKAAKAINADIISPYYKEVTAEIVTEAHSLGLKVIPWTVNIKEEMEALIDMGVDGIITDRPDILKEVIIAKKILI